MLGDLFKLFRRFQRMLKQMSKMIKRASAIFCSSNNKICDFFIFWLTALARSNRIIKVSQSKSFMLQQTAHKMKQTNQQQKKKQAYK